MITPVIIGINANNTDIFIVTKPDQKLTQNEAIDVAAELIEMVWVVRGYDDDDSFNKLIAEVVYKVCQALDIPIASVSL